MSVAPNSKKKLEYVQTSFQKNTRTSACNMLLNTKHKVYASVVPSETQSRNFGIFC